MDIYIDENLPHRIASAMDAFDEDNNVIATEKKFGKEIKDVPLIGLLNSTQAHVLITNDLKFKSRLHQYREYQVNNISVFMVSLSSGANDYLKFKTIVEKWELMMKICRENPDPFVCRIYQKKIAQSDGKDYQFF